MSFRLESYTELLRYLGETDATVELLELARRSFVERANASPDIGVFVGEAVSQFGVQVNLSNLKGLEQAFHLQNIVIVYQAWDRFIREARRECYRLHDREAVPPLSQKVKKLNAQLHDFPVDSNCVLKHWGDDLVTAWEYYHSLRFWTTHHQGSDPTAPQKTYDSIVPLQEENQKLFERLNAPNQPKSIGFDDFLFFTKLVKLMAQKLCEILVPTAEQIAKNMNLKRFHKYSDKPDRKREAITRAQGATQKNDST